MFRLAASLTVLYSGLICFHCAAHWICAVTVPFTGFCFHIINLSYVLDVSSPVAFPKKYDADGKFVKHYLPILCKFPPKYIYEPWKAPINIQKEAGCIIGYLQHQKDAECHLEVT
jgi:hypothetical protein